MTEVPSAKRLLYVITKATWGGAQRYVYDLAVAAKAAGYEVAVAYGEEGLLSEKLTAHDIPTHALPGLSRNIHLKAEWQAFKALFLLLRKERPDIVHVNSSKGGLAALAARLAGVKRVVFTVHGWAFNEERPWWQKLLMRGAYALTLWLSHVTICVSNAVRNQMAWLPFSHLAVVRNAVEVPVFLSPAEAREALVPGTTPALWVGMLAELHPTKRVEDAIDALIELTASHPDLFLVVIGEGTHRSELEERIAHYGLTERVRLVGFKDEGSRYLRAFDIFLMPSRTEALGLALLEAGHAGLPVIAARVGGIPEIIQHKKTGLLIPRHNPHALALALRTLIEHPDEAKQYASALQKHVEEKFSKVRMVEDTLALYEI